MNKWKCPIENLDEDIREVVRLLFNNNMKPYMSCSGSYKDHKEKQYIPESACVEMLDSEATRELMAMLIKDKRFKCSIAKERARVIYDNDLPNGLRFMIEFENICGEMQKELMAIIQSISHGKKADIKEREKIDVVCNLIDTFDVIDDSQIMFSFNDEMMLEGKEDEDNYSIEIRDRTDFEDYFTLIDHAIEGYEQDENRTKFYGNDFLNLSSTLRKIISDYRRIPKLAKGKQKRIIKQETNRTNRFIANYSDRVEIAQKKLEEENKSTLLESKSFSFEDLMGMFDGEK